MAEVIVHGSTRWQTEAVNEVCRLMLCANVPGVSTSSLIAELDDWLDRFPEREVEQRLTSLEQQRVALLNRHTEIENELQAIGQEIAKASEALTMKRRWDELTLMRAAMGDAGKRSAPILRGREAILRVMQDDPVRVNWTIGDVHSALLERGWVNGTDTHTTQVNLSRMFRKGQIARPVQGIYRLLTPDNGDGRIPGT
jgi:hypothetical protein